MNMTSSVFRSGITSTSGRTAHGAACIAASSFCTALPPFSPTLTHIWMLPSRVASPQRISRTAEKLRSGRSRGEHLIPVSGLAHSSYVSWVFNISSKHYCFFAGGVAMHAAPTADLGESLELTDENVEMVLDEIRPYLMAGTVCPSLVYCLH